MAEKLYVEGSPVDNINELTVAWLRGEIRVKEHAQAKAFSSLRLLIDAVLNEPAPEGAHRHALTHLTPVLFRQGLREQLGHLSDDTLNIGGFRTAASQGFAKNWGENFVNAIVYILCSYFIDHPDIVVAKGSPPPVRKRLAGQKLVTLSNGVERITYDIESDFCAFSRSDPHRMIVANAKTRLKEVFHIGTMWALLLDSHCDPAARAAYSLTATDPPKRDDVRYVFATADSISEGGKSTQGSDIDRPAVRNLIKMDASYFDYVFVSKPDIDHVSKNIDTTSVREALFHELGTIIDLIEQHLSKQPLLPSSV